MMLTLYAHPFSSYCQKVLVALWEKGLDFTYRHMEDPGAAEELKQRWPIGRFPIVVNEAGETITESSIIIEYLDLLHPGANRLIPADPQAALEVRFLDRFFDTYVMSAMQKPVFAALKGDASRKQEALKEARTDLETAYGWLEQRLGDRRWAAGGEFTLADCAAAPSLFYADWVHEIGAAFPAVRAYRARLLARPSFARAVEEARPYRAYFPLGAPDRD